SSRVLVVSTIAAMTSPSCECATDCAYRHASVLACAVICGPVRVARLRDLATAHRVRANVGAGARLALLTAMLSARSIGAFLLAALTLPLLQACARSQAAPARSAPPIVSVVEVTPESVEISSEWIATLDGFANAQIRPQVTGYLIRRT